MVAFVQALQALAHLPERSDARVLAIEIRLTLGNALTQLGEHRQRLALLGEAEALARALGDRARLGWVLASKCLYKINFIFFTKILDNLFHMSAVS